MVVNKLALSVILDLGRLRQEDHWSPEVRDQSGQHSETLSLENIKELARLADMSL